MESWRRGKVGGGNVGNEKKEGNWVMGRLEACFVEMNFPIKDMHS